LWPRIHVQEEIVIAETRRVPSTKTSFRFIV
jgi:hypothetical protein